VIEHGGTSWWVPLLVALAAALASYVATGWLKRADINRESAFRAADLIDDAEQVAAFRDRYDTAPDGARQASHISTYARCYSRGRPERRCAACGAPLSGRADRLTCSTRCRMRVHRQQTEPWEAVARRLELEYAERCGPRPMHVVVRDPDLW
jgi:hypothetical protein